MALPLPQLRCLEGNKAVSGLYSRFNADSLLAAGLLPRKAGDHNLQSYTSKVSTGFSGRGGVPGRFLLHSS